MEALATLSQSFGGMVLLKSTLIVSLVFALGFLLRKASAASRHFLWTLCFIALLVLPLATYLSVVESSWRIPVPVLSPPSELAAAPAPRPAPAPLPEPSSGSEASAPTEHAAPAAAPPVWQMAWILGSSLLTVRLMAGLFSSYRTGRRAPAMLDDRWLELLEETKDKIGIRHDVRLALAASSAMPITLGVFRPSIHLPESSESYSEPRRSAVLLHELAHVRRRDCLTQLVSQVACAIFWWHPLVWIGARQMRSLSERASDDLVIDTGTRPSEYAHDLLDMARGLNLRGAAAPLASVTMAHRSRLEERLLAILDDGMTRGSVRPRIALPSALFGSAVLLSVGLAMPTAARAPQPAADAQQPAAGAQQPAAGAQQEDPETAVAVPEQESEETEARESATSRRAREALAEALDDSSASVREQALHALVRLRDESTVPYLVDALESGSADMREQAAWGLGMMRRKEAAGSLARALTDEIDNVREQAAWALGMIKSEDAVAALAAALTTDASSNVREQSAWALGMIKDDSATDALVSALRDDNANVRSQTAWACGMLRSGEAVDGLVGALTDADGNVRSQAAWALGMIRDKRAIQGLGKALGDESVDVREQAIWAVGMIRSPESFDVLIAALGDASADIRSQAAWALGMLGDSRAIDALSVALKDNDADVREQAAWALGRLAKHGDDDVDLDDMDVHVEIDDLEIELNGSRENERRDPPPLLRDALL